MCAFVACKLIKSKCECDMVARWVAEGKRIEWHKHEKMLPGKDFAFLAAEPSAGVGQLLIEGVYDVRHRDDG